MDTHIDALIRKYLSASPNGITASNILKNVNTELRAVGIPTLTSTPINSRLYHGGYAHIISNDGGKPVWGLKGQQSVSNVQQVPFQQSVSNVQQVPFQQSVSNVQQVPFQQSVSNVQQVPFQQLATQQPSLEQLMYQWSPYQQSATQQPTVKIESIPYNNVQTSYVVTPQDYTQSHKTNSITQSINKDTKSESIRLYVDLGNYHNTGEILRFANSNKVISVKCYEDAAGNISKPTHPKIEYFHSSRSVVDYTDMKMTFDICADWREAMWTKFIILSKDKIFGALSLVLEDTSKLSTEHSMHTNTVSHVTSLDGIDL